MKGINQMRFNEATMIEIVQSYLDAEMVHAPQVTSVRYETGGGSYSGGFVVTMDSKDEADR